MKRRALIEFVDDDQGQDVIEYGLLIATVTVVVLLGMASFGNQVEPWVARLAIRITIVGR